MKIRSAFVFTLLCLFLNGLQAQQPAIGEWRSHLPYNNCIAVAEAGRLIYCASPYSLFCYNREDESITRIDKVNGLSDVEISSINYNEQSRILVVAYANANIDLITEDGIRNISDIKRKPILGNKRINHITFLGSYAYLSCGFGIVVLDLARKEIYDTYYIGPTGSSLQINDFTFDDTCFYAATASGIYSARRDHPNLANFAAWTKDSTINAPGADYANIVVLDGKLITSLRFPGFSGDTIYYNDGTGWQHYNAIPVNDFFELRICRNSMVICGFNNIYVISPDLSIAQNVYSYNPIIPHPRSALIDEEDYIWVADLYEGLVRNKVWDDIFIKPNGPPSIDVYSMAIAGSNLWVAPGSLNSFLGNTWNNTGPSSFIGETWYGLKQHNPAFDTIFDVLYIAIDPSDHNRVFASTWGKGLAEFRNGLLQTLHSHTNSALEKPFSTYDWVGIAGISFDQNGNLWVLNSECNQVLKVLKADGNWVSYNVSSQVSQPKVTRLLVDSQDYKWMILFGSGILVYNNNGTLENKSDDQIRKLSTSAGSGALPSGNVLSIAEDLDGEIWIGTDKGIAVIYTPGNLFSGGNYDAQVITIEQDGTAQHLLEFESVTAITVDGANKKWVGTQRAGVFLFSEDGQKEIHHLTAENSPLLSNTISSIVVDGKTGEVFFGTDKGICSFKGYATTGKEMYENVYAYPNPVPPGYGGMIGIKGLTRNSWIKITDVAGNLIYETRSEGGQAVWNGCNFSGDKAQTGVYFVFCIAEDGSERVVTKIMIHN